MAATLRAVGLFTLIATASAALAAGPSAAERAVDGMSLRQLAGHAVLMRFNGDPAPAYALRALRRGEAAGVILFRDNATSLGATRALTRSVQRAAGGRAIVATDQEGGTVRVLGWARPVPGQSELGTPAAVRRAARGGARDLRRAGVTLDLAPVADLSGPGSVMDLRAFPGGPRRVARSVAASVRAYAAGGVQTTLKHFPGLGATDGNTDKVRVTIRAPLDLEPFRAGIAAGAPAVMLSHAWYPRLDRRAIASQSRAVVQGLLRRRLGFRGVAMTDSLEAYSVRSRMSMERAAVRSMRAGIDLVLTTGQGTHLRALRALVAQARRSRAFRTRLRDAATRVVALQDASRR